MRAIGHRVRPKPVGTGAGFFVVFEGGEGAGKTTQMEALVAWLKSQGIDAVTTHEPGGTEIGNRIRAILLDTKSGAMDAHTEALLYAADRAQHVAEVIRPALEAGKVVVSDRYIDSSLAYQGIARGLGLDQIYRISEWATGGVVPDLVFFLSVDPREGLARAGDQPDRIEQEGDQFHAKVRDAYLELAQKFPSRFVVLDGGREVEQVHRSVIAEYKGHAPDRLPSAAGVKDFGPPGPVPR